MKNFENILGEEGVSDSDISILKRRLLVSIKQLEYYAKEDYLELGISEATANILVEISKRYSKGKY